MDTHQSAARKPTSVSMAVFMTLTLGTHAVAWQQRDELPAPGGVYNGELGDCLRVSGDYAIVGDPHDDAGGPASGAAYVLRRVGTTWVRQAKLTASDAAAYRTFGHAVALDGDRALIGAAGGAYVFVRSGTMWTQQAKLTPADGSTGDFGQSVSIDGDSALVGAPNDTPNGIRSGSAYVFARTGTTWTQQAKLTPSVGADGDSFGLALCLQGDCAIIGAPWDDADGTESGCAYVFIRTGTVWTQQTRLAPAASYGRAYDHFPSDISMDGAEVLFGTAYYYASGGVIGHTGNSLGAEAIGAAAYVGNGSAYLFARIGAVWTEQAKLVPTGDSSNAFGYAVSLQGDYAVVGDFGDHPQGRESGSAYVFKRAGSAWTQQAKLTAANGQESDWFGQAVGLSGESILIGAPNGGPDDGGSVYVFSCKVPVHRFWAKNPGRHFYTIREAEKTKLINNYASVWEYEGIAYQAHTVPFDSGLAPVYRFWSDALAGHFYTVNEAEKNKVLASASDVWTYEGIAFYAYPPGAQPPGAQPVYRFWSPVLRSHFYTTDAAERDKLLYGFADVWTYEQIAWYVTE